MLIAGWFSLLAPGIAICHLSTLPQRPRDTAVRSDVCGALGVTANGVMQRMSSIYEALLDLANSARRTGAPLVCGIRVVGAHDMHGLIPSSR